MNALNFLDANVWLALLWNRHIHSEKAARWFDQSSDEQFFFCRFTQLTVPRLLTTEKIMGKDAKNMAEAWSFWDQVWADAYLLAFAATAGVKLVIFDRALKSRGADVLVL